MSIETKFLSVSETVTWPEPFRQEYKTMIARLMLRLPNLAVHVIISFFEFLSNKHQNPIAFHLLTSKQQHTRRIQHENEMLHRIKWCLDQHLSPAHDCVHLSEGDDRQFMFGVCPWTRDGGIAKEGVPYGRQSNLTVAKEFQLVELPKPSKPPEHVAKPSIKIQKMMRAASGSRKITSYAGL